MLRTFILGLTLTLLSASSVSAAPRFYKDWRWWIGEGVIVAAVSVDAVSTTTTQRRCPGCVETAIFLPAHPTAKQVWINAAGTMAFYTAMHASEHWLGASNESKYWRLLTYASYPALVGTLHGLAASNNYGIVADCKRAALNCS